MNLDTTNPAGRLIVLPTTPPVSAGRQPARLRHGSAGTGALVRARAERGRRVLLILLACVLVAAVGALVWPGEKEPTYLGKTLMEWLLCERLISKEPESHDTQTDAIRRIGSNAVPFLLKWVRYRAPATKKELLSFLGGLPRPLNLNLEDKDLERSHASWAAFRILGPQARAAIPELTRMMDEPGSGFIGRYHQPIYALGCMGEDALPAILAVLEDRLHPDHAEAALIIGFMPAARTNCARAVPLLVSCLVEQNEAAACRAAISLGRLGLEPGLAVPALTNSLADPRALVRRQSARALGEFGAEGRAAGAALLQALDDLDFTVRLCATNSLSKIAPEMLSCSNETRTAAPQVLGTPVAR